MNQQIKMFKRILSEKGIYTENIGIKELAAPPYQRINWFSKKSLQNHIEGSETDHIERVLQNQYQRWGYNPEMLCG